MRPSLARFLLTTGVVAVGIVGAMLLASDPPGISDPQMNGGGSSIVMSDLARFTVPAEIDLGATRVAVAVTESRIFFGAPPLAADSVYVFGFDGARLGSVYVRPDRSILGVSWILGLPGDRALLHLFPSRIGTINGRSLELENWRYAGISSLDAVLGDTAFASARPIRTPELFGYWWYWGLLEGGALVPVDERHSVNPSDSPLFGLQDAGERGMCGLNVDRRAIRCWDTLTRTSTDYPLHSDEPSGPKEGLRAMAIRDDRVWFVIQAASENSGRAVYPDHDEGSDELYAHRTYRVVVRPFVTDEPTVGIIEFRGRFVRFTPHGHLITLERVGNQESVVVRQLVVSASNLLPPGPVG